MERERSYPRSFRQRYSESMESHWNIPWRNSPRRCDRTRNPGQVLQHAGSNVRSSRITERILIRNPIMSIEFIRRRATIASIKSMLQSRGFGEYMSVLGSQGVHRKRGSNRTAITQAEPSTSSGRSEPKCTPMCPAIAVARLGVWVNRTGSIPVEPPRERVIIVTFSDSSD